MPLETTHDRNPKVSRNFRRHQPPRNMCATRSRNSSTGFAIQARPRQGANRDLPAQLASKQLCDKGRPQLTGTAQDPDTTTTGETVTAATILIEWVDLTAHSAGGVT